jgi:hypothetical protein
VNHGQAALLLFVLVMLVLTGCVNGLLYWLGHRR